MVEYSEANAIIISLIIGMILTILFDNVFIITFIGFISTYMTNKENKSYLIGIKAALIFTTFNFLIGMIIVPEIPYSISEQIGLDPFNLFMGFLIACFISGMLGFFGGYIAEKTYIGYQRLIL